MFDLKKYWGVILYDTDGWCKIWRTTDFVWKMTWGIWQIFTRALESLKYGTLIGSFNPDWKCMSLKSKEELCVMTMKNDAKFDKELTCHFKIDITNLTNFDPCTLKVSKILILMCSFWAEYILFELKKYRRSYLSWNWRGIQNLKGNWLVVSKWT